MSASSAAATPGCPRPCTSPSAAMTSSCSRRIAWAGVPRGAMAARSAAASAGTRPSSSRCLGARRRAGSGTSREEAKGIVRERVARHAIDCDLTPGQLIAAAKPAQDEDLRRRADKLARDYDYAQARYVPAAELARHARQPGILRGPARHAAPCICTRSTTRWGWPAPATPPACASTSIPPRSATRRRVPSRVRTEQGEVTARHLVLGCDGYLGRPRAPHRCAHHADQQLHHRDRAARRGARPRP